MLDSYGDLGAGEKISTLIVFDTIIHNTLLKYFKSLVTYVRSLNKRPRRKIQVVVLEASR